jgi:predicted metalloprotease with PDZ domain
VNSTILQTRPTAFDTPRDRRNFLALVSHEFFHTWNVKNFRPKGLKPYDYDRENYTNLLWVAEGTTTYYDELMCVRAGVWTPAQYLESLARTIDEETTRPGAQVQSLEGASFDAWVKFNRPTPDSVNSTVSFYSKGALVNFLLDASIRKDTNNAKSLDDVMRALNDGFPLHSPNAYSTADLLAIIKGLTGKSYDAFFASYVSGTSPIDATEALATFGLERAKEKADDEAAGNAWAGVDVRDGDGMAVVTTVRADGPAAGSGLMTDDQIVAIDGVRVRAGEFDARVRRLGVGTQTTFTLFRRDVMRTITLTLGSKPRGGGAITRKKEPSASQKAAYEHWLGASWEP